MEKLFISAVVTILLAGLGLFVSMVIEPTGFNVACNETSFSMPAGTMSHAIKASKEYTGCTIEKMDFSK